MKLFKSRKSKIILGLSVNAVALSAALIISTVAWYSIKNDISNPKIKSFVEQEYFDVNEGKKRTDNDYGTSTNPYVITKPVHYYNMVRLYNLGTYGFNTNTVFQFGKVFAADGTGNPKFCKYSPSGVYDSSTYVTSLEMNYYQDGAGYGGALPPLGTSKNPFVSQIVGNNLTISNLHINGEGYSDVGIFGYVSGNTTNIQNIYFDSPIIDAGGANATAESGNSHAGHNSHVYIGYLGGHVSTASLFSDVYLNKCKLRNAKNNSYEMINNYGYFGKVDDASPATANSNSYSTNLSAASAYEALDYTYTNGDENSLELRNTDTTKPANAKFNDAVKVPSSGSYRIDQKDSSNRYSLSSIGYSNGSNNVTKHVRYFKTVGNEERMFDINNVDSNHILNSTPANNFYGMDDGAYIYYDNDAGNWKYADVVADLSRTDTGTAYLNCFTISYKNFYDNKTYYLKCNVNNGGGTYDYDTLVNEEWNDSNPAPTSEEYLFCFKTSFGSNGKSRFTEVDRDNQYYIYSPKVDKYLCTFSYKSVDNNHLTSGYLHTPVFVDKNGTNGHTPLLFTIGGPKTQITYTAKEGSKDSTYTTVDSVFENNLSNNDEYGALFGSYLGANDTRTIMGGHKLTAQNRAGIFYIGNYTTAQTTDVDNAVNYKKISSSSELTNGSKCIFVGYRTESGNRVDYAMSVQSANNRSTVGVDVINDGTDSIINGTSGVAILDVSTDANKTYFAFYNNGYLYNSSNKTLYTESPDTALSNRSKWTASSTFKFTNSSTSRKMIFLQNSGGNPLFNCYDSEPPGAQAFDIYIQQSHAVLQGVKYTSSTTVIKQNWTIYPYKQTITPIPLKVADQTDDYTDPSNYDENLTVSPSLSPSFNTDTSTVSYNSVNVELWKRVGNIGEIKEGDQVFIACELGNNTGDDKIMSTTQNTNNRGKVDATITPPYLKGENLPDTAQIMTLQKVDSNWRFYTGSGYLYAASNTDNHLKTEVNADLYGNADFSISILNNGNANIIAQGNHGHNKIMYNSTNSLFSCYESDNTNQNAVQIYRLVQRGGDQNTYVGDLMDNFEPSRMDAVGPNLVYSSSYIKLASGSSSSVTNPSSGNFYMMKYVTNAFVVLVDATGSCDLGTLTYQTTSSGSDKPYFMVNSETNVDIVTAGAIDDTSGGSHKYLININTHNISNLALCSLKGEGTDSSPLQVWNSGVDDISLITKYVLVLGCADTVETTNIAYTFTNEPGNVGVSGKVDYRSATYDNNGAFTGTVQNKAKVDSSNLSIYYDVTNTGQQVSLTVEYKYNETDLQYEYIITVNTSETSLTQDLVINIYKYDNSASVLKVTANGETNPYTAGAVTITLLASYY